MSSIGGHSVITIKGTVNPMGEMDEEITRRGVSGLALRGIGERGLIFNLSIVADTTTSDAADTLIAAFKALQHTLVTVIEDTGITTYNVAVRSFTPNRVRKMGTAVGGISGDPQYLVTGNFAMQCTT